MRRFILLVSLLMFPVLQAQALIIGTTINSPPLASFADQDNHFVGFEIEIMQNICKRIRVPCLFKAVTVNNIPELITSQAIDLGMATIIIPDKPMLAYLFSIPYLPSDMQFIAKKTSTSINTMADIKGKIVGVRSGKLDDKNMFRDVVLKLYNGQVRIIVYDRTHNMIDALHNDDIDVAFTEADTATYWLDNIDNENKFIGNPISVGDGYGIMAASYQGALITKINQALSSMMTDGSYQAIYSRYF